MAARRRPSVRDQRDGPRRFDDLTVVRGVGEALERWLRESFDVSSVADLAALTINQIQRRAKVDGRPLSGEKIREILANASEIAKQQNGGDAIRRPPGQRSGNRPHRKRPRQPGSATRVTFTLRFDRPDGSRGSRSPTQVQTRIVCNESGDCQTWPGVAIRDAGQWLEERLCDLFPVEVATAAPAVTADDDHDVEAGRKAALILRSVRLFQPVTESMPVFTATAVSCPIAFLRANAPYALEVDLLIPATVQPDRLRASVTITLREMVGGRRMQDRAVVEVSDGSDHGEGVRMRRIGDGIDAGTYRLALSVSIDEGKDTSQGSFSIPLLQVFRP